MDIWKVTAGHTVIFNTPKQEEKVYVEVADLLDFGSLYPGQILYPKQKNKVKNLPSKGLHRFEFVAGRNELGNVHIHSLADLDENRFDSLMRSLVMVTVTPGSTAPLASVATPAMEPVVTCAKARGVARKMAIHVSTRIRRTTAMPLPPTVNNT